MSVLLGAVLMMKNSAQVEYKDDGITWIVCNGNIAEISADAIVCAANSMGLMRGGASQALRIKGGDVVEDAARRLAPIRIGSAVVTTAGQLDAVWVIHAPTISEPVETTTPARIEAAAYAAVRTASDLGARSIAFPGLGLGVGEVNVADGAKALVSGVTRGLRKKTLLDVVKIVLRQQFYIDVFCDCIVGVSS